MVSEAALCAGPDTQLQDLHPISPTRTDWRLLLGLSRSDSILVLGGESRELARVLRPWARRVYGSFDSAVIDAGRFETAQGRESREQSSGAPGTPESLDWIIIDGADPDDGDPRTTLARLMPALKPGGRVVVNFENLGPLAVSRRRSERDRGSGVPCRGLAHARGLLATAGCTEIACYAVLPNHRAPRTLIPVAPSCPPAAEKFALGQASKRAARKRVLGRLALHLLIDLRLLRHLYPHYLVVGRKPC